MSALRIVFMGTGDIAIPTFSCLLEKGLVALITQPDKPVGRKQVLTPPRIKEIAISHGVPVIQPEKARDPEFLSTMDELNPDVIVVMAYGQILTQRLLDIPRLAFINLHASLLPRYRGAACIQAAIDAGDSHTGITVMHVVKALDAGDIILQKKVAIGSQETGGELHDRLTKLGPGVLLQALEQLADGSAARIPQNEDEMTYVPKLMREDGKIDWSMPAEHIERRIRAYDPWPGTSTVMTESKGRHQGRKKRLKIFPHTSVTSAVGEPGEILNTDGNLLVACGEGALEINELQPDGSRRMSVQDFLLSKPVSVGDYLG